MLTCRRCARCLPSEAFYTTSTSGWCRGCYRAYYVDRNGGMVSKACKHCNIDFECTARAASRRVFCSRACKDAARREAEKAARLVAKAAAPKRACAHCGEVVPPVMRADARFCSERCNSAAHQVTRKMAARVGEPRPGMLVSRAYIAERDRWRCGVCGERVHRSLRHPDPLSASIDHVIPVAHGGGNGPENLRLAHLRCNVSRRDTATDDQLMLVG